MPAIPDEIALAAQSAQRITGIPASVSLAQWALESGWGAHMPPSSNNPFGVKALPGQPSVTVPTHEVVDGQTVTVEAAFQTYPTLADAFVEHARLLAGPRYRAAQACLPDVLAFCRALTGIYATAPGYGDELCRVIEGPENLRQYDLAVPPAPVAALNGQPIAGDWWPILSGQGGAAGQGQEITQSSRPDQQTTPAAQGEEITSDASIQPAAPDQVADWFVSDDAMEAG